MHLEDGEEMSIRKYFFSESADESIAGSERGWVLYSDYEQLERTAKMLAGLLESAQNELMHDQFEDAGCIKCKVRDAIKVARKDGLL
jgi:hypothetical protein